ncbi:trace amine-associated receptor 8a-like [Orbicella faveolata]|uniref:trace amine-associated receptor 8a-like n=1 Tax=Orbicella faveolata TaxID=48498 RepID=UPI0009E4F9D7|nr:trace amine-associated receptor 8a-like [Orbicella faveolata]XP_020610453.1 trace amine-associated receptor 8a-like [Orbicella faveolata]
MEHWFNVFGWLLSIVTAAGNGFVIFLVSKTRRLHLRSANLFVLSLAVADFGVGIAVFPSSYFCNYSMACNLRVQKAFFWFLLHSSVTNLCTLTWDRYIAIAHPFKYNNSMTKRRPGIVILIAWSIPFAISLSLLVGIYVITSNTAHIVIKLTGVSAFDIICCVLLFYAVVRILVAARAKSRQEAAIELQIQSNHSIEFSNSHKRRKNNTARFIIALVVFFLGCYVAVNYLVLCLIFSCHIMPDQAGQVVSCLLVLNSAVNPFVYALLKKDIKEEISKLITKENNHRVRSSATTTYISGAECN